MQCHVSKQNRGDATFYIKHEVAKVVENE